LSRTVADGRAGRRGSGRTGLAGETGYEATLLVHTRADLAGSRRIAAERSGQSNAAARVDSRLAVEARSYLAGTMGCSLGCYRMSVLAGARKRLVLAGAAGYSLRNLGSVAAVDSRSFEVAVAIGNRHIGETGTGCMDRT